MAHKKAQWSVKNLKDSNPKYRWIKKFWWQSVLAGNIVLKQKWSKYECGENVYLSNDFSIHARIDWLIQFSKKNKAKFNWRKYLKTFVSVV